MFGNATQVFPQNDTSQAVNLGFALHEATQQGMSLSDALTSLADSKPTSFGEATSLARGLARQYRYASKAAAE